MGTGISLSTLRAATAATHPAVIAGSAAGDPSCVAPYMLSQMQRNISTACFVIIDTSTTSPLPSSPGCVIASPSYKGYARGAVPVDQDYVYNWTRDAAITVSEILHSAPALVSPQAATQTLTDYIAFADSCQKSTPDDLGRGKYNIQGGQVAWSPQSDGPALRVLSILQGYSSLDPTTKSLAGQVIARDLTCLLSPPTGGAAGDKTPWYRTTTFTHWEDTEANSLFARAVQLRCFNQITENTYGIPIPSGVSDAIEWLMDAIPAHWDDSNKWYSSLLPPVHRHSDQPPCVAYDPAIDPVMACLYGDGIECDDPHLLSTAAAIRDHWTNGAAAYPINAADGEIGLGPLIGRYADDGYDGDDTGIASGHPWVVCTCNFAQLYYCLANAIADGAQVPSDPLANEFFAQIGIGNAGALAPMEVIQTLRAAGDKMLNAVVYHSDRLSLSEQFDQATGYEKSVVDLTWSYGAFLSAVRTRLSAEPLAA
jgi:glucoamylase